MLPYLLTLPVPSIQPLATPTIPTVQVQEENDTELWWVHNTHSEWTVIEDCWQHPSLDARWFDLEGNVRIGLQKISGMTLASGDLNWYADGFCVRTQGLYSAVLDLRAQYLEALVGLNRSDVVSSDLFVEPKLTLDDRHNSWLTVHNSSFWNWRQWQNFWVDVTHRMVVYSPERPEVSELDTKLVDSTFARWIPRTRTSPVLEGACWLQYRPEYTQAAVTVSVRYPSLSSAQTRAINTLLGTGVRSRLSEYLREELGLVYSIGSQYTGRAIQISYSVDPTGLNDSLDAIQIVLARLTKDGVSDLEARRLRSMFLLRQYQILEDPASMVRMLGRFDTPTGWAQYIEQSLVAIASLPGLVLAEPDVETRITAGVAVETLTIPCSLSR